MNTDTTTNPKVAYRRAVTDLHRNLIGATHAAAKLQASFDEHTPQPVRDKLTGIVGNIRNALTQAEVTFAQTGGAVSSDLNMVAMIERSGGRVTLWVHGVIMDSVSSVTEGVLGLQNQRKITWLETKRDELNAAAEAGK